MPGSSIKYKPRCDYRLFMHANGRRTYIMKKRNIIYSKEKIVIPI